MAKVAITNLEVAQSLLMGQSDIVLFDSISDYSTADWTALKNPKSLGQIVQESTSWEGDDVEREDIKDEQGDLITSKITGGTVAFSFDLASTSKELVTTFLKGSSEITGGSSAAPVAGFDNELKAIGFGTDLPVFTAPIMIINDEGTRALFVPKAKISSNLNLDGGLWRIKVNVLAEFIDSASFKTCMILEGKVTYSAE